MRASSLPLLGRDEPLTELVGLLESLRHGIGRIAFVEGPAGIGKSRLIGELAAVARAQGCEVAIGGSSELDANRAFAPLLEALRVTHKPRDEARAGIAELIDLSDPGGEQVSLTQGPGAQFRAITAFIDLIGASAAARPLALVLEDLHWADSSTVLAVRSLARRLDQIPVLVLASLRGTPRRPELERVLGELQDEAVRIDLGPLDPQAILALAGDAIGGEPGPRLRATIGQAGGNPLFAVELVRGLEESGGLTRHGRRVEVAASHEAGVPSTLRTTILHRVGLASSSVLEVLRLASVLGSSFALADLAVVSGRLPAQLVPDVEEAIRAGIVEGSGDRLVFRHELVRQALYESIPIALRSTLHRDAGQALAGVGAPAVQVAGHLSLGAPDAEAVEWLVRAGRETMAIAPGAAAALLERAVDLSGDRLQDRAGVIPDLVVAEVWCGRSAQGVSRARRALAEALSGPPAAATRTALIQALWLQGRWQDALAEASKRCAAPDVEPAERARLLAETASARVYADGPAAGAAQATTALAIAEELGDDAAACAALWALTLARYFQARHADAVAAGRRAVAVAEGSSSSEALRRHPHFILGVAYVGADRLADAGRTFRAGELAGERLGTAWDAGWYQAARGALAFFAGDWADAVAEAEAAVGLADDLRTSLGRAYALSVLGLVALHRDELDQAARYCEEAQAVVDTAGNQLGADWVPWLRALVDEARGDPVAALDGLSAAAEVFEATGMTTSLMRVGPDLVRLAVAAGEPARARRLVDHCVAATSGCPDLATPAGVALRCQGLLTGDPAVLLQAAEAFRRSPRRVECAAAIEDAARVLAAQGAGVPARRLFEEALETYDQADARRDQRRVISALRTLGVRHGARGRRDRPTSGWSSLTETEDKVVSLVAAGLSNPEIASRLFISRNTVETHLRHVFAKLGVHTRAQVAAESGRRTSREATDVPHADHGAR